MKKDEWKKGGRPERAAAAVTAGMLSAVSVRSHSIWTSA